MSHETTPLVGSAVERVPTDLLLVVLATVGIDLGLLWLSPGPLRFAIAVPLLFVLPGYALVCALFPARATVRDVDVDGLERAALSLPVSLAVLAAVGLSLTATGTALAAESVLAALSLVVVWGAFVAGLRRRRVPADRRFDPTFAAAADALRSVRRGFGGRTDAGASLALAGAMVVAAATLGYGLAVPPESTGHDSLHLLTEGSDGALVAGGYPDTLTQGEETTLVVGVDNEFDAARSYTVVVQLERVGPDGAVTERVELDRLSATVGAGERLTRRHEVTPTTTGEELRLSYLLFVGDAPAEPTRADARHATHLWVTVEAA